MTPLFYIPGRYVGVAADTPDEFDFSERLGALHAELEDLTAEAHRLETEIRENVTQILAARV